MFYGSPNRTHDHATHDRIGAIDIPMKNLRHPPHPSSFDIKKQKLKISPNIISKSWNNKYSKSPNDDSFKPYDPINNCKSAGIIPYTLLNGNVYFLLQKIDNPLKKKDSGWNDFGGKKISITETTAGTAGREFSEETSCLFYIKENFGSDSEVAYNLLKDNEKLVYPESSVELLKDLIPKSQEYFSNRITEYVLPIYISSKETYISYFIRVQYIPEKDIPRAEDIHIEYENRYIRTCKWFTLDELMNLSEKDFHKRLQITRIQQRIRNYYNKGLFI